MSAPTCLGCGRAFLETRQLATLPHAQRVAFDSDRERAWRVCIGCGEWNLLAADTARAVTTELREVGTRLRWRELESGIGQAEDGPLQLLRLALDADTGPAADQSPRQLKVLGRQRKLARIFLVLTVFTVAYLALSPLLFGPIQPATMIGVPFAVFSATLAARALRERRLGRPVAGMVVMSAVAAGISLLAAAGEARMLGTLLTSWPLYVAGMFAIDRWLPVGRTALPSGGRAWIRRHELDATRLSLDADGALRVTLPSGRLLARDDGDAVLRDLLDGYSWETSKADQLRAAAIVRGDQPLAAILAVLRPMFDEHPDGVLLINIPPVWRAALDLALVGSGGAPGRLTALAEKARDAQQVAAIAESLDRRD